MNILYLAHRIPFPPNKGDKIRSYHQIQYLAKNHTIYLACLVDDVDDLQYVDELKKYCQVVEAVNEPLVKRVLRTGLALVRGQALTVGAFYSHTLQQRINAILESVNIDRIIVFSSPMAKYVRHVNATPKLMDFVDVDSEKWREYAVYQKFPLSLLYRLEAYRLGCYEKAIAEEFEQSVFISAEEANVFCDRVKNCPVNVIPNGVDIDFFQPHRCAETGIAQDGTIVFTAAMDYFPNIDAAQFFCRDIFPRICELFPQVRFDIVGRKPDPKVLRLAQLGRINVTGTVPDVRPYLETASIAVVPLRIARGVQNKILEAMAMGLPVVGTSNAFEGISVCQDNGIRIVDDPIQFADEVISLLHDPVLRTTCGIRAREFVRQRGSWDDCGAELERLVHSMS
ncbi:TIGR03087 family PEP-CTERM/XrtA system glycosyltransferase [Nitrospira sp. M1]